MLPLTPDYRNAARWLTRQPWQGSPEYWVEQARIRYQLSPAQSDLLLHSMTLQAS